MYWYLYYIRKSVDWLGYALELRRSGKFVAADVAKEIAGNYVDKAERCA